jgi:hypothetical protein
MMLNEDKKIAVAFAMCFNELAPVPFFSLTSYIEKCYNEQYIK